MNLKKRNKIYFLIAIVFVAFWFYNFRWIEFIPLEYKDQGVASFKNPYIARPEWITDKNIECFKKHLHTNRHDYTYINKKLHVRAYLARNYNLIDNIWGGSDKKEVENCTLYGGGEIRSGFFPEYTGYNSFSYFLDKLIMWNWDEPEKKK